MPVYEVGKPFSPTRSGTMNTARSRARRRSLAQYFTPEAVVAACYAILAGALPPDATLVDPSCGDGAFLRYALAGGITSPVRLYGCDIDESLVTKLSADGLPNVRHGDGLSPASLPDASFDLVIGNPPFGLSDARSGPVSEVRFLLRAIELARPGGLIALVLPNGILANERLRDLRARLVQQTTVLAVIETPRETFRAMGTSAACSVLVLRNAPAPPGHETFFGIATRLDDLAPLVDRYHRRSATADGGEGFWLAQGDMFVQRMDAGFWRPQHRSLLERMAARWPIQSLGQAIGRGGLIVGDHVRRSRGESRGPGLPFEYYQTREFLPAGYNYAQLERCDELAYRRLRYTAVRRHDILVSCAGVGGAGRGRVCLVTHEPGPSCTGDVLILRPATLDPVFLFLFLRSHGGREQLLRLQNGVGTVNLSAGELLQVQVPLVAGDEQRALAAAYGPIAAAHDRSMAALAAGDTLGFEAEQALASGRLAGLVERVEELCR